MRVETGRPRVGPSAGGDARRRVRRRGRRRRAGGRRRGLPRGGARGADRRARRGARARRADPPAPPGRFRPDGARRGSSGWRLGRRPARRMRRRSTPSGRSGGSAAVRRDAGGRSSRCARRVVLGDRRARALPAVSGLDPAGSDGRRRGAGDGKVGGVAARAHRGRGRLGAAAAAGRGVAREGRRRVALVAEQAGLLALARFAAALALCRASSSRRRAIGAVSSARRTAPGRGWSRPGPGAARSVALTDGRRRLRSTATSPPWVTASSPNTELARLLGCETRGGSRRRRTAPADHRSPACSAAGEPCGVAGLEVAIAEGEIAGLAAAGGAADRGGSPSSRRARLRGRRLAAAMERAFRPRARAGAAGAARTRSSAAAKTCRWHRSTRCSERARSEAVDARRHGAVPGPRVRPGARVPLRLGFGYGTPAAEAGARSAVSSDGDGGDAHEMAGSLSRDHDTFPRRPGGRSRLPSAPRRGDARRRLPGFVPLGSLGEAATLSFEEKGAVLETCRKRARGPGAARRGDRRALDRRGRRDRAAGRGEGVRRA